MRKELPAMNKITVWDFPIRVFHWLFSISLSLALIIAFFIDDDNSLFPYHMLFGLTAGFLLVIRIVIGLIGARYSRFRGLVFPPGESIEYIIKSMAGGVVTILACSLWVATLFWGYDAVNTMVSIPEIGSISLGEAGSEQEHEGSHADEND